MNVVGRVWTEPEKYKDKNGKEHVCLVLVDEDERGRASAQFFRAEVPEPEKYKKGTLLRFWGTVSFANMGNVRFRTDIVEMVKEAGK